MTYIEPTNVSRDQLACRGSRVHWMESIPVPAGTSQRNGTVTVWWRCVRCTAERHDQLHSTTLAVVGRRYQYPDGYLEAGEDRPTPATWRATYYRAIGVISGRQASAARRYRKELWEEEGSEA